MIPKIGSRSLGPVSAEFILKLIERGKDIFTLEDAYQISDKGRKQTIDFLHDLVKRGVLARIKSGVYLILKMGQENTQLSNWPIIAHILADKKDYYISHYSAMRLHGMTTHPLMNVTITRLKKRVAKKVNNIYYQFIYCKPEHFWGVCEHWVTKQDKIYISDIERTILDGLDRPDLCGGIKEIIRGIWSKQNQIDWNKLVQYSQRYHTRAAVKRLGFIFEMLNLGLDYLPLLQNIIKTGKDYVLLDPKGSRTGKHLQSWRVQLNMNIDELKASIWG